MADTTYVKMPQADYVAICDAVREKNGESTTYVSGAVPSKIAALETVGDVTVVNCGTSSTTIADLYDSANGGSY